MPARNSRSPHFGPRWVYSHLWSEAILPEALERASGVQVVVREAAAHQRWNRDCSMHDYAAPTSCRIRAGVRACRAMSIRRRSTHRKPIVHIERNPFSRTPPGRAKSR